MSIIFKPIREYIRVHMHVRWFSWYVEYIPLREYIRVHMHVKRFSWSPDTLVYFQYNG